MKSKVGIVLALVYLVGSVLFVTLSLSACEGWGCGIIMAVPIMPWSLWGLPGGSWFAYGFWMLVNAGILYLIGMMLGRLVTSMRSKSNLP